MDEQNPIELELTCLGLRYDYEDRGLDAPSPPMQEGDPIPERKIVWFADFGQLGAFEPTFSLQLDEDEVRNVRPGKQYMVRVTPA